MLRDTPFLPTAHQDLFQRKLIIVAGKGGVGKSTVAATLALLAARRGKKVLLIGADNREGLSRIFDTKPLHYVERRIAHRIWGANISGREALEEFLILTLRIKAIYNRLLKNQLFQYFVAAAPGLEELFILGKLWHMQQLIHDETGEPLYDVVVFDAPATGHSVLLFKVPRVIMDSVRMGPIYRNSKLVEDLLKDAKQTVHLLVTLPEEMPVAETIELHRELGQNVGIPYGGTIVNRIYPEVVPAGTESIWRRALDGSEGLQWLGRGLVSEALTERMIACARAAIRRRELGSEYLARLRGEVSPPFYVLPFLFHRPGGVESVAPLVEILARQMGLSPNNNGDPAPGPGGDSE